MSGVAPPLTPASKRTGTLVALLNASGRGKFDFRSHIVDTIELDLEGIVDNRHRGWTRKSDARVPYLPRGTPIRNTRQVSIVSLEDCADVARLLGIPSLGPAWIGANVAVKGLAHLSYLPRGTRMLCAGGAILCVEDQNVPCAIAAEAVQAANPGHPHVKGAFVKSARGLRGVLATVEHPGLLTAGTAFTARLPVQWIYP